MKVLCKYKPPETNGVVCISGAIVMGGVRTRASVFLDAMLLRGRFSKAKVELLSH